MKNTAVGLAVLLIILLVMFLGLLFDSVPVMDGSRVTISISKGFSSQKIGDLLIEKKLIRSKAGFLLVAKLVGAEGKMQAGVYRFEQRTPLFKIITKLWNGETAFDGLKVTFPEGTSIYKMGLLLKQAGYQDWRGFQKLSQQKIPAHLMQEYIFLEQVPIHSLEGYLYPDTYFIFVDTPLDKLVEMMLEGFNRNIYSFWQNIPIKMSLSLHKFLSLASIVEKEAVLDHEEPIIASVFFNRLKIGMPLEADPTVKYALEQPTQRVYYNQLEVNSPYNTYKSYGIPPGPICNPGFSAFAATLSSANTDFLFFVANKDGSHIFSKTWAEHQKARQSLRK